MPIASRVANAKRALDLTAWSFLYSITYNVSNSGHMQQSTSTVSPHNWGTFNAWHSANTHHKHKHTAL